MSPPTAAYPITNRGIALIGFMGAGKTTAGRALARRLGTDFVDLDAEIEARHGPLAHLFERGVFREVEGEVLRSLPTTSVLALGGGSTLDPRSRAYVETHYRTVFLDVDEATASRRTAGSNRPLRDIPGLWSARQPVYATCRHRVDADAHVEQVVDAVCGVIGELRVPVDGYDVRFVDSLTTVELSSEAICIADSTVDTLYGPTLAASSGLRRLTFPPGVKTLESWATLIDSALALRPTRATQIVGLGGGVSGDMAGFVAASLLRGVPWQLVPTTTLAMLDSSVGGKTGLDHALGKNLVGAFHRPQGVWIVLSTLKSLDPRQLRAGLAEAVKIGAVVHAPLFEILETGSIPLEHVILQGVRAKAQIVREDEREAGIRRVLNAGHTVGHALETTLGLLHGEAVSIGLVAEARFGVREGLTDPQVPERLQATLGGLGLPTELPEFDEQAVLAAMQLDKKGRRDSLSVPLPVSIGSWIDYDLQRDRLQELLT